MRKLEKEICAAVENETLSEPFNAVMIKDACPGWDDRDYHLCIAEHGVGNGHNPELFERVSFGLYCLTRPTASEQRGANCCQNCRAQPIKI